MTVAGELEKELPQLVNKHFKSPSRCQIISGIKWLQQTNILLIVESCLSLVGKAEKKTDPTVTSAMIAMH